jgi:hypothetical protein
MGIYSLVDGQPTAVAVDWMAGLCVPPDVPTTSIYSRSDGMVAWQACVQSKGHGDTENIEVEGSHLGLAWNSSVFEVIADRLCQPEGAWRPYSPVF